VCTVSRWYFHGLQFHSGGVEFPIFLLIFAWALQVQRYRPTCDCVPYSTVVVCNLFNSPMIDWVIDCELIWSAHPITIHLESRDLYYASPSEFIFHMLTVLALHAYVLVIKSFVWLLIASFIRYWSQTLLQLLLLSSTLQSMFHASVLPKTIILLRSQSPWYLSSIAPMLSCPNIIVLILSMFIHSPATLPNCHLNSVSSHAGIW